MRPIIRTLTDTTTLGLNELEFSGNEGGAHIPNNSKTLASPSDCLVSYPGHLLADFIPSTEMQSAYSITPANWVTLLIQR